jgi:thiosulfate/3-mercaptopyruvate sulfurtransferase
VSFGPIVDTRWLREHLGEEGLAVVDCRWVLGEPGTGRRLWSWERIPGAAFLDVDGDLSAEPGPDGRHPLPEPTAFEEAARGAGIEAGSRVVAYDEAAEGGAARLWWLLRHFGHTAVAVLDGGMRAWREAGGASEAGEASAARDPRGALEQGEAGGARGAAFTTRPRSDDAVSAEELAGLRLLDARTPERFRGEREPVDPVAGHIPGARNVPFAELVREGRFLPPAQLRERLGEEPFVAYCGSGITASNLVLAAAIAGVEARLYPGSWSEWIARGGEVATGD